MESSVGRSTHGVVVAADAAVSPNRFLLSFSSLVSADVLATLSTCQTRTGKDRDKVGSRVYFACIPDWNHPCPLPDSPVHPLPLKQVENEQQIYSVYFISSRSLILFHTSRYLFSLSLSLSRSNSPFESTIVYLDRISRCCSTARYLSASICLF